MLAFTVLESAVETADGENPPVRKARLATSATMTTYVVGTSAILIRFEAHYTETMNAWYCTPRLWMP